MTTGELRSSPSHEQWRAEPNISALVEKIKEGFETFADQSTYAELRELSLHKLTTAELRFATNNRDRIFAELKKQGMSKDDLASVANALDSFEFQERVSERAQRPDVIAAQAPTAARETREVNRDQEAERIELLNLVNRKTTNLENAFPSKNELKEAYETLLAFHRQISDELKDTTVGNRRDLFTILGDVAEANRKLLREMERRDQGLIAGFRDRIKRFLS